MNKSISMEECIFDKKILVSHTLQSYRCFKRLKCCKDLLSKMAFERIEGGWKRAKVCWLCSVIMKK